MKNAYPEKPELLYQRTSVEMGLVVAYIKSLNVPKEIKCAAYVFFRIESANGKSGVNNNYAGIQADGARWPAEFDSKIAGTSLKKENGTGNLRRFVCFHRWEDSVDFTVNNAQRRGLFVGGQTWRIVKMAVQTVEDLCTAYKREWVTGNAKYLPGPAEVASFSSMYNQAAKIF
ncbi:hypothetical protein ACQKLP_21915 [Chitinophaga sp. NPDC101104]|uniref:hypothetical protein n=1 Tax=Chitinophaga sp. NPDC101104 TaxID=3390561 RepID=UPI003D08C973